MNNNYEKAIQMLKTEHKCPSDISQECNIDKNILHDMTCDCYYDECACNCDLCREDALMFMMKHIK